MINAFALRSNCNHFVKRNKSMINAFALRSNCNKNVYFFGFLYDFMKKLLTHKEFFDKIRMYIDVLFFGAGKRTP